MPLSGGDKLGPYEILGLIGKGGMGEVYKARDTRLDRVVAIKVSKTEFSERFEREAKAIGALNHPNICTLYDVGPNYLVMEYVEGAPLKGPLPLDQALKYAVQICDALDAAHKKGITHRDLKPANILVTKAGIKLLDFGLAKLASSGIGQAVKPADDATLTMALTGKNEIVGTLYYMSPEQLQAQANGQDIDGRSDIFSFGLVLYEMLTGKRAVEGSSPASVIAAIMERPAPSVADIAPLALDWTLKRCLEKDPDNRWQTARDLKAELERIASGSGETAVAPVAVPRRGLLPWIATALLAIVAASLGVLAYRRSAEEPPRVGRFSLLMPEKTTINTTTSLPAISPDGRTVAVFLRSGQQSALWLRDLDGLNARLLAGTEGAAAPFWSPDSRSLGFFTPGKLKKIDINGGPALALCDVEGVGRGGTWSPKNDVIVYGTVAGGLFRVAAAGGAPVALTAPDPALGENNHRAPWFLPDGQHFLYTARSVNDAAKTRVYVDSIEARPGSHTRREVLAADTNAVYVPRVLSAPGFSVTGYLLFARERTLMAQPFDPGQARSTGEAVPIAEGVNYSSNTSQAEFTASRNGTLVYDSSVIAPSTQITWFDRGGRPTGTVGIPAYTTSVSLSPDGSTVATDPRDTSGKSDIWLHDLARGTTTRFTFGPGLNYRRPVWSPDGSRIGFFVLGGKSYIKPANTGGVEEVLDQRLGPVIADWSRDGRYLIEDSTDGDIWVIPQFGDKKPFPYVRSEYTKSSAKLSPSGQWLVYVSDESKRNEVYVQTFPERGGKWQISTNGGNFPVWSRDGRELYFLSADRKMMAVEVKGSGKSLQAGVPKALFEVAAPGQFDVSKDGRFLIQVPMDRGSERATLTVVTNWQAGLKK